MEKRHVLIKKQIFHEKTLGEKQDFVLSNIREKKNARNEAWQKIESKVFAFGKSLRTADEIFFSFFFFFIDFSGEFAI